MTGMTDFSLYLHQVICINHTWCKYNKGWQSRTFGLSNKKMNPFICSNQHFLNLTSLPASIWNLLFEFIQMVSSVNVSKHSHSTQRSSYFEVHPCSWAPGDRDGPSLCYWRSSRSVIFRPSLRNRLQRVAIRASSRFVPKAAGPTKSASIFWFGKSGNLESNGHEASATHEFPKRWIHSPEETFQKP